MFTVALLGPDGAGKTTIGRRLESTLPFAVKYLYMGVNVDSSNVLLPTTRLVRAVKRLSGKRAATGPQLEPEGSETNRQAALPRSVISAVISELISFMRLANRLGEEWFRQGVAWYHVLRGRVVVFDRHFYSDYYAHDVVRNGRARRLTRRVHGFVLTHFYPKPDLLILLDAPAELLFARKPEGTLKALEKRRAEYLELKSVTPGMAVVDVGRPEEEVAADVAQLITAFERTRGTGGRR